jgi:TRAP-type transport system periplasmic protein
MKKQLLGALCAAVVGLTGTAAQAKIEIKVASIAPKGTPWIKHLEAWEKAVEEKTNGEIDIKIFAGGQLGNEFDAFKQVQRGRLDAASLSGGTMAEYVPELALMSTPFLFDKAETIDCIYDGNLGNKFKDLVEAKGMKHLQWGETGWVYIYAKDDLSDVKQAKGYKTRVAPHPMSRTLWNSVAANGVEIPYAETPAALQTGMVRAGESAAISFVAFGLGKVAPHFMRTEHMHQAGATIISNKKWKQLSTEQQKIVTESLPNIQAMRKGLRGISEFMLKKYMDAGGPVHKLSTEQRNAWRAEVEPNWPTFVKELGGGAEKIWPEVIAAKKSCGE